MTEAGAEYRRALDLAPSDAERRYLAKRLAPTSPGSPSSPDPGLTRSPAPAGKEKK